MKKVVQRFSLGKNVDLFLGDKKFTPRASVRLAVEVGREIEADGVVAPLAVVRHPNPIVRVIVNRKLFARVVTTKEVLVHVRRDVTHDPMPGATSVRLPEGHTYFFKPSAAARFRA